MRLKMRVKQSAGLIGVQGTRTYAAVWRTKRLRISILGRCPGGLKYRQSLAFAALAAALSTIAVMVADNSSRACAALISSVAAA